MKKTAFKMNLTRGEKFLFFSVAFSLISVLLLQVFCGASISHFNMSIEELNYKISSQEKKNESLVMQVNELTSFDTIKDVVKNMGLAYNNENIIVISE